jgi:hypothetical protein
MIVNKAINQTKKEESSKTLFGKIVQNPIVRKTTTRMSNGGNSADDEENTSLKDSEISLAILSKEGQKN